MNTLLVRGSAIALAIGLIAALSSGCAVTGGGYADGDDAGADIGLDYYETYGIDYGGWGPGYRVAPFRDADHQPAHSEHEQPHAYRSAPASHTMPSIPSRSRSH